ncbi:MAG: hypothetical protein NTU73_08300 [Ignavibacteriae bacterium]|nr:hypothetical protein [Ignavibacteriota bacterium]
MKKITSILIILLLFFDSCGYIFVYIELSNYFKQEASIKINDFISDDNLEIIALHKSELSKNNSLIQFINENEIKYKGELYDIYKEVSKEDSVYYYCLNDNDENILEKAFAEYVENNTQEKNKNTPINSILDNIIKSANVPSVFNNFNFQTSVNFITQNINFFSQYSVDIPTPPPKNYS